MFLSILFPLLLPRYINSYKLPYFSSQKRLQLQAEFMKRNFDELSEKFLQPIDFQFAAITPVDVPSDQELNDLQNPYLFEGDIQGVIEEISLHLPYRDEPISTVGQVFNQPFNTAVNLATYPDKLWPDARVPYVLEEGLSLQQRAAIAQAFDEYKIKTCIRFVPREKDDHDYVHLKRNGGFGCSSFVGRSGGEQTISLEVEKCFKKGVIDHELMHSIGFFHEHSRTDRDDYVWIKRENIQPGMARNFEKYSRKIVDTLNMPYDYNSVMHYHKLAFSKNGKATISPKDSTARIGQRIQLSEIDAYKINKLYQCNDDEANHKNSESTTKNNPKKNGTSNGKKEQQKFIPPTTTSSKYIETKTIKIAVERITACKDLNVHCALWQSIGHCEDSNKYMNYYCRKSCGFCDRTDEREPKTNRQTQPENCSDANAFCSYWAKLGECSSDSRFMKVSCRKSCGKC